MKHIKVIGKLDAIMQNVEVTVVEVTAHTSYAFGGNADEIHPNLFLGAYCCLSYDVLDSECIGLNSGDGLLDICIGPPGTKFKLTIADWQKFKHDIILYNKWGSTR